MFLGFISYITTLLAIKPILPENVYLYTAIIIFLFFFSMIVCFGLVDLKREVKWQEKCIIVIVGIISFWVTYLNFNATATDSKSMNIIIILIC